jgi:hypothetical protein
MPGEGTPKEGLVRGTSANPTEHHSRTHPIRHVVHHVDIGLASGKQLQVGRLVSSGFRLTAQLTPETPRAMAYDRPTECDAGACVKDVHDPPYPSPEDHGNIQADHFQTRRSHKENPAGVLTEPPFRTA